MRASDILNEAPMNPSSFAAAIKTGHEKGVLVGFEFEVCVPKKTIAQAEQQEKLKNNPEDYIGKITEVLNDFHDSPFESDIFDTPLSTVAKTFTPNPELAKYPTFTDTLSVMIEERIPKIKELFNQLPDNKRPRWIEGAQRRVDELLSNRNDLAKYPKEIIFSYFFGRVVYYDSMGKNERIGYEIQTLSRITYEQIFQKMFDTDYKNVYSEFTRYFTFDPKKAFTIFFEELYNDQYDDDYDDDEEYDYRGAAKALQPALTQSFGKTNIFTSYHQDVKNLNDWYIEPDGSLQPNNGDGAAEIVTPPLPANDAILALKKFYSIAKQLNLYTDQKNNTGLHINVSIPADLDVMKLAVFLGDQYVLQQFDRLNNRYASSVTRDFSRRLDDLSTQPTPRRRNAEPQPTPTSVTTTPNKDVFGRAGKSTNINYELLKQIVGNISNNHFASINFNGKYVSFRHAGGDYLNRPEDVLNVVGRFVRAMVIASDPEMYKDEYKAKVAKIMGSSVSPSFDSKSSLIKSSLDYVRKNGIPVVTYDVMKLKPNTRRETILGNYEGMMGYNTINFNDSNPDAKANIVSNIRSPEIKQKAMDTDLSQFFRVTLTPHPLQIQSYINVNLQPGVNYVRNEGAYSPVKQGLLYASKSNLPSESELGKKYIKDLMVTYLAQMKKDAADTKRREASAARRAAKKATGTQ